jgi:hypothetical protein
MSLTNTKWTISGVGEIVCEFKPNNIVTMTFHNGQSIDNNWDELNDAFAIESPNSTVNPHKWEVYSGTYFGSNGLGVYFNFGVDEPRQFTITKNE